MNTENYIPKKLQETAGKRVKITILTPEGYITEFIVGTVESAVVYQGLSGLTFVLRVFMQKERQYSYIPDMEIEEL